MTRRRARVWSEVWLRRWTTRGFVIVLAVGFTAAALHHH